jgi:hydrogenase maturation factor
MVRVDTVYGVCDASIRMVEAAGTIVAIGDWVLMSLGLVVDVVDEAEGRALLEQMRELQLGVES